MNTIYRRVKNKNSKWKFNLIKSYLSDEEKVLDLGCGDLGLAKEMTRHLKQVRINGIDVIPLKTKNPKSRRISYQQYDGVKIPYPDKAFDLVIVFYVLHHCKNPQEIIAECARVARKRVLVVESIPEKRFELPFMRFFDWFFNFIKFDMTPLPYQFKTVEAWSSLFKKAGMRNVSSHHPKSYEDYVPFGKLYILEFEKKN